MADGPERGARSGRTIRQAIAIALEGMSGDLGLFVCLASQRAALRTHVRSWVHDYARNRGVLLEDSDIDSELDMIVDELRRGAALRSHRLEKLIVFAGQKAKVACDGMCHKAWGNNSRPRVQLSKTDPDDYAFKADEELGDAPDDPGTYEGGHGKPKGPVISADQLNKWCVRECERSVMSEPGRWTEPLELPDFSTRYYNKAPHTRDR